MTIDKIYNANFWVLFGSVVFFNFVGMYCVSQLIWNDNVYLESFTGSDFSKYIDTVRTIDLYRYLLSPFYIFIKSLAIACVISIGLIISNEKVGISPIIKIALISEMVFVIYDIIKAIWFLLFISEYSSSDIKEFSPLSIYQLIGGIDGWLSYPLKTINLFHLFFALMIGIGLRSIDSIRNNAYTIALVSYGIALSFWIVIWMFIGTSLIV